MNRWYCAPLLLLVAGSMIACENNKVVTPSAYETAPDVSRAKKLNDNGVICLQEGKLDQAEHAFKDAIAADIAFGPAHNNLGRVYYERNRLYEAAWEFQYASKLMPGHAEPLNNLGQVYEAAGKWNDAIDNYGKALSAAADDPEYVGNLARAKVRRGDKDEELAKLLQRIIDHDLRPEWVSWARNSMPVLHPAK